MQQFNIVFLTNFMCNDRVGGVTSVYFNTCILALYSVYLYVGCVLFAENILLKILVYC